MKKWPKDPLRDIGIMHEAAYTGEHKHYAHRQWSQGIQGKYWKANDDWYRLESANSATDRFHGKVNRRGTRAGYAR